MKHKNLAALQLFAADTVVNGTTDAGLTAEMKTYYNTELLKNARPAMVHLQFAKKQPLPADSGRTVEWRKFNTLPSADVLTEGVIPDGKQMGTSVLSDSLTQHGMYVTVSDLLDLHAIDNVIVEASDELAASAGKTQDELVRNDLMAGTNVIYADHTVSAQGVSTVTETTSRSDLDATSLLTPTLVNKAATQLKKMNAPTVRGKYVAIIHPSVAFDLRQSSEWIEAHKYAAVTQLFDGEIGELHGVRFVETTQAKVFTGAADGCPDGLAVYATLFLGDKAYGVIDPAGGNLQMIVKNKGEAGGPLEQFSTIGYKFEANGAKILYEERMLRVETCSAYSAVDSAN